MTCDHPHQLPLKTLGIVLFSHLSQGLQTLNIRDNRDAKILVMLGGKKGICVTLVNEDNQ